MPLVLLGGYFIAVGVPYHSFEDHSVEVVAFAKNSRTATEGLNSETASRSSTG